MEEKWLSTSFLRKVGIADHDGLTNQISNRLTVFPTEVQRLIDAIAEVAEKRAREDAAYKKYSAKDFTSDDLKREGKLADKYMSCIRGILRSMFYLPETEPMRRKAQMAYQLFKDFAFDSANGFEAGARKIYNMAQQWRAATQYTTAELGIEAWVDKADEQAAKVIRLVETRVENESAKARGEMAEARKQTDAAIREAYDIINAMMVLDPTPELTQLVAILLKIEERAKQYYISGGTGSSSNAGSSGGSNSGSSSNAGSTDSGNTGNTGDTGSGDSGNTGNTGDTGNGDAGNTGNSGDTGNGDAGNTGNTGNSGNTDPGNGGDDDPDNGME